MILTDINVDGVTTLATKFNNNAGDRVVAVAFKMDTTSFEEQMEAFAKGKEVFGRIDYGMSSARKNSPVTFLIPA